MGIGRRTGDSDQSLNGRRPPGERSRRLSVGTGPDRRRPAGAVAGGGINGLCAAYEKGGPPPVPRGGGPRGTWRSPHPRLESSSSVTPILASRPPGARRPAGLRGGSGQRAHGCGVLGPECAEPKRQPACPRCCTRPTAGRRDDWHLRPEAFACTLRPSEHEPDRSRAADRDRRHRCGRPLCPSGGPRCRSRRFYCPLCS